MDYNKIYTVGHSNYKFEDFRSILDKYNIDLLVDTRSHPGSKKNPQFNKENFETEMGARYFWMPSLGGQTDGVYSNPSVFPKHHICAERADKDILSAQLNRGCTCNIDTATYAELSQVLSDDMELVANLGRLSLEALIYLYHRWPAEILGRHKSIGVEVSRRRLLNCAYIPDRPDLLYTVCDLCSKPWMVPQWYNMGLYDYAMWMGRDEVFTDACIDLNKLANGKNIAIMCAEALWYKCHRSLISDAWVAWGGEIIHIGTGRPISHKSVIGNRLDRYDPVTRIIWYK